MKELDASNGDLVIDYNKSRLTVRTSLTPDFQCEIGSTYWFVGEADKRDVSLDVSSGID